MKTVRLGLNRLSQAETLQLLQNIITGTTGNANFASPNPTLVALQALLDDGTTCVNDCEIAADALAMKRTACAEKFTAIRNGITLFSTWAVQKCAGDRMKLESVGLEVRADAAPIGPMAQPQNLQSFGGELEGTVGLQWEPVYGRFNYFLECAQAAAGPWSQVYTGRASNATCGALTPGAEYFFRVRAQGAAGLGPWSDITKKRAS